jgi:hypothetical protein
MYKHEIFLELFFKKIKNFKLNHRQFEKRFSFLAVAQKCSNNYNLKNFKQIFLPVQP